MNELLTITTLLIIGTICVAIMRHILNKYFKDTTKKYWNPLTIIITITAFIGAIITLLIYPTTSKGIYPLTYYVGFTITTFTIYWIILNIFYILIIKK